MQLSRTAMIIAVIVNCQLAAAQYGGPPTFAITNQPPVTTNNAGNLYTAGTSATNGQTVKLTFGWYDPMPTVVTQEYSTTVVNGAWSFNPQWGTGAGQIPYVSGRAMTWAVWIPDGTGGWTLKGKGTTTMQ